MYSFEKSLIEISRLVDDFKANESHYLDPSYSEADVRNDFINKFYIALGWDVRHETQKNPYEQEVRVEKPVQFAKAQKRADYSFSINPNFRTVKFFVEAKKPAHALENKDYYFQTARYGWNANTPIAVLTDFEEFHIIDCRFRPDINDALNYKIEKFHYTDYADEEKFRKIYYLFSREAVADNSIEKYVDALPKPRGKKAKGLKAVTQTIDESFLEELDEIRNDLAKSFKKNNTHLSSEELTEATQRTIDRLVFIKFLEDKLIEPDHYVSKFVGPHPVSLSLPRRGTKEKVEEKTGVDSAWEKFIRVSRTLDAKYNGVVFKKSLIDTRNIIEPDDKTFSAICEELSHENTPYNFDAIPIHILGSIYERFLGKVVNATDKRVTIEEKPEVRKAGGVYYTPQYFVNYIVDNTVGKLIEGKTSKEIAKMRFADIACGSGSFLITVFERLLDYHKRWYIENPEQAKKDGCILVEGTYRLSLKQKTKILLNNVYGVDIDQQAVEVTQLSLYLKLLEDETTATANDSWVLFKEQLLPDLNKNIVCGNSLIGTDILDLTLFPSPHQGNKNLTPSPLLTKERELKGEVDELKLKPMDFETVFPEVMSNGGFDAIVGNPPYVFGGTYGIDEFEKKYFKDIYESGTGKVNLFTMFIEKSIRILKEKGLLSYIIPNTFLRVTSYANSRKFVLDNAAIREIVDLGTGVFKGATTSSIILILERLKEHNENKVKVFTKLNTEPLIFDQEFFLNDSFVISIKTNADEINLLDKLKSKTFNLGVICKEMIFGVVITKNSDKVVSKEYHNGWKPYLEGKDIGRYEIKFANKYLFYEPKLLHRPRTPEVFEVKEKILIQRITGGKSPLAAAYDTEQYYNKESINNIILDDKTLYSTKFILGVINSKLINWFYKVSFTNESNLTVNLSKTYLSHIPIVELDFKNEIDNNLHDDIVRFVDQMLTAKKQLQQAKTESDRNYLERKCETLDKQIDQLVYQLYGLTEEEIKIVEGV